MRKDRHQRSALGIGLALSAGVFSIMPVAYGATASGFPEGGDPKVGNANIATAGTTMNITSSEKNNVIDWQDFSVASGKTVCFDNGNKTNNYMNVVSGGVQSQIDGSIVGGNEVYIINPQGVVFGANSSVDVGSLYVSTRNVADDVINSIDQTSNMAATVLSDTSASLAGDVVNLRNVQADSVFMEGNNITFVQGGTEVTESQNHRVMLVNNEEGWANINNNLSGKNILTKDLDFSDSEKHPFTIIGNSEANAFTGTFDGQFHVVEGFKVSGVNAGGLFGYANNAKIENVGVKNVKVTAINYAGGIVGKATNTDISCVYNEGGDLEALDEDDNGAGGIVGYSYSSTVDKAYNTGMVKSSGSTRAGGIVGIYEKSTFSNVYNENTSVTYGLVGRGINDDAETTLKYAYTLTGSYQGAGIEVAVGNTVLTTETENFSFTNHVKDYESFWNTDTIKTISNKGGENTPWRIYEGYSRPLLRDFLTANGTVTINYNYKQGAGDAISNGGADVENITYNHKDIVLSDIEYQLNGTTFTPEAGIIVSPTDDTVDGNVEWYKDGVVAKSAFYDTRGQHGYDLVGNNVTIKQRAVDVTSDLANKHITKEYDGTPDAKDAAASLFSGSSTTVKGIIDGDNTVTISPNDVTAYFLPSSDDPSATDDSAQVGSGKRVKITGSLTILNATIAGKEYHNYTFTNGGSANFGDGTILTDNTITEKSIYVELKHKTGIDKIYDGTAKTVDDYVSSKNISYDTTVDTKSYTYDSSGAPVIGDTTSHVVTVGYDEAGTYASKDATTSPVTVSYGGLYISAVAGETLSNYKLVDKVTGETISIGGSDTKGTIYGTGTIGKKSLNYTGFSWYDGSTPMTASKQYDNSSDYTEPEEKIVRSAQMANDNLTFRVQEARFAINADDNTAANTSAKNVDDAHGVVYTITIDGTDAANYDLSNLVVDNKYIVVGEGNITPRVISLTEATGTNVHKIYDATATVKDSHNVTTFKLSAKDSANQKYDDGENSYHLLNYVTNTDGLLDDGSYIEYTGAYSDGNVNYDNGSVKSKDITYTATIQAGNGNYVFDPTTKATTKEFTHGSGIINQRELANLAFTHAEKTYDGGTDVKTGTFLLDVTQVPLQGEDTAEGLFNYSQINGVYLSTVDNQPNAHVENGGAQNSKNVTYSWASGVDIINNHNYKLADGVTGGTGQGAIKPFAITDRNNLSLAKANDITKTYDGKDNVANSEHNSQYYVGDLTYTFDADHVITLDYTVPGDSDTFKGAYYASADVAVDGNGNPKAQDVTYNLAVSNTGDYTIDDTLKTDGYLQWTGLTGTITKKDLTASLSESYITDGNNKAYDGKTAANNDGVVFDGWIDVTGRTKTVTARYDTKDADDNKVVTYEITLGDTVDTFSQNNYNLLVKQPGSSEAVAGNTITGKGNISKAPLAITFGEVTKEYDGDTSYTGVATPDDYTAQKKQNDAGVTDDVSLVKYTTDEGDRWYSEAHFTTHKVTTENNPVTYTVALTGEDAKNYVLTLPVTGSGKITTKGLQDDDIVINFADVISKVYDTYTGVSYDHTDATMGPDSPFFDGENDKKEAKNYINTITINGLELVYGTDYTVSSADYDAIDAGERTATYKLEFYVTNDKLSDFDFSQIGTNWDDTNHILTRNAINDTTHTVEIIPKKLQATVNVESVLEKVYDGTNTLPISPEVAADKVSVTGFVNREGIDTAYFDKNQVNARYKDENVEYDGTEVTNKEVDFTVKLAGTGSANYVINDTGANTATLTSMQGRITPLPVKVNFGLSERNYNGDNDTSAPVNITLTKTDGSDLGTAAKVDTDVMAAKINGNFMKQIDGVWTPDGHVNYDSDNQQELYKAVKYTGIDTAFNEAAGTLAGNYTFTSPSEVLYEESDAKGIIHQLELQADDIHHVFTTPITKQYDGYSNVKDAEANFRIYTDVLGAGKEIDLGYTLKSAVYDGGQVNVTDAAGVGVTYTLENLKEEVFTDFKMPSALINSFKNKTYTTVDSSTGAAALTGTITPRVLQINLTTPDNYVKTYDGDAVIRVNGSEVTDFAYTFKDDASKILDTDNTKLTVSGAYVDKTANIEPESEATTGKTIIYTLKLKDNTNNNYTLDITGKTVKNEDADTYKGSGAIKKRPVYVGFKEGYGSDIDKPYDGTTLADDNNNHKTNIEIKATTIPDTGIISGDAAALNDAALAAIEANYESKNVARDADGKVSAQTVNFTNIKLQGDDGDNYAVRSQVDGTAVLKGSGTINPLKVTVTRTNAPTKKYNGHLDIDTAKTNFTADVLDDPAVVGEDVLKDFLTISGQYNNADAGQNKDYTYSLSLTGTPNYELVNSTSGTQSVTVDPDSYGQKATLNGNNGVIDKRTISVNFNGGYLTKVYDGNPDGTSELLTDKTNELYDATNNTDKPLTNVKFTLNNVVDGDVVNLTGTATLDGQDAADPANPDELKEYNVTYTLNLDNLNYQFKDDGSTSVDFAGKGYIARRGLVVTATPVSINAGEAMPQFTGTVTGFVNGEQVDYSDFIQEISTGFKAADNASNTTPGSYGVYGWYMGSRTGMLDLNYTFEQSPANDSALTVNYVNTNNGNPDTKITPNNDIYKQISKDMNSGFGDNGAAAIEYKDKSGKVLGTEKIDSGEINGKGLMIGGGMDMSKRADSNANIGIAGGDIVNMEGANAAGSVNIETNGEGTVVNLEVFAIDGEKQNIIGEDVRDKKDEKEGEIAIKSSNGEDDDEIELTVEKQGVNVA